MDNELLFFNGIDGATGGYLLPPLTPAQISAAVRGEPMDPEQVKELKTWQLLKVKNLGLTEGVDPKNLAESGWGVIFPYNVDPSIPEALKELLDFRQEMAARAHPTRYKIFSGPDGYRPGESKTDFLTRQGVGPGPVDPDKIPYYLLIVGDPETIPYRFQSQLDVQFAVGRIWFDAAQDYANYAHSVVEAEKNGLALPREAVFFGVSNPGDPATNLSASQLAEPLVQTVTKDKPGWNIHTYLKEQATKDQIGKLLGGPDTPALFFSASHGMGFPYGDPRQFPHQGALLCQDWPGPEGWHQAIPEDFYFSADDIDSSSRLFGLIAFHFACYGLGTPHLDEFARQAFKSRAEIAPRSFLARLPQRLLAHPNGGALAVVGHVERAWGYSFTWGQAGKQLAVFESTFKRLMEGHPVGSATEKFNERYAELASDLSVELEDISFGKQPDDLKLSGMWTANNDARNYMILGDPAVRLMVAPEGKEIAVESRPVISQVSPIHTAVATAASSEAKPASTTPPASSTPPAQESPPPASAPIPIATTRPESAAAQAIDYGLLDNFKQIQTSMGKSLEGFITKLGDFLSNALDDAASLEVSTYVSDDLTQVEYKDGQFKGGRLRALTRIRIDGDALVCIPEGEGEVDAALWKIHMDMVNQAQSSRAELLKTMISATTGLVELLKP